MLRMKLLGPSAPPPALLPEYYKNIPCIPALFLLPQNILLDIVVNKQGAK